MMIHAAIRWPVISSTELWPMAISYAVWLYNHMPKSNGFSPLEIIVKSRHPRRILTNAHVFGCPTYVLDPKLQNYGKLPKFSPRSRRGVFLGFSLKHSSTVPLILNLDTLSITPQYHVVFDDWFTTVTSTPIDDPVDPIWSELFADCRFHYQFDEDDDIILDPQWNAPSPPTITPDPEQPQTIQTLPSNDSSSRIQQPSPISTTSPSANNVPSISTPSNPILLSSLTPPINIIPSNTTPVSIDAIPPTDLPSSSSPSVLPSPLPSPTPRRSQRLRHAPIRYGYDTTQAFGYSAEVREKHQATTNTLLQYYVSNVANKLLYSSANLASSIHYEEGIIEYNDPFLFQHITGTQQSNKDTFKYHEAIYETDWEDFVLAATKEIKTLEEMGTWDEVLRSSVPMNKKVLGGTWVFRRKRGTDGKVLKHKARYCVRGDQQTAGVDYFDSYAPVCMWSTVRLLLILSVIADLAAVQVDYTNAFAQANLNEEVYIEFPKGFSSTHKNGDFVLKLKKSLYGLVQAPCTFYKYLTTNLKKFGFSCADSIDPCLWINHKTKLICVIYVDDCLLFSKEISTIYKFIEDI
jgi:Reverse transcriptase (RNA-dependent DNA polymerase)